MRRHFPYPFQTGRTVAAWFLAALVLQVMVLKEVHHAFEHCHEEAPKCLDGGAEKHLHGAEYAFEDCPICLFHFSPAKLELTVFQLQPPTFPTRQPVFSFQYPPLARVEWSRQLRGPPAPLA